MPRFSARRVCAFCKAITTAAPPWSSLGQPRRKCWPRPFRSCAPRRLSQSAQWSKRTRRRTDRTRRPLFLLALRQLLDLLLKRVDAVVELIDIGLGLLRGLGGWRGTRCAEGREHLHGLLEEREVLLSHLLELAEREHAAEGLLQALAHLLLIEREGAHRLLEVARHHPLQAVAVEADQLAQE